MTDSAGTAEAYRDRSRLLIAIGPLVLVAGVAAAFIGPLEIHVYYAFSEDGRFHYPGFGFGSFMFANIAAQVVGYYLLAALLIPLGYGHLKLRPWARTLALTLLWTWLVVGLPLLPVLIFMLLSAKGMSLAGAIVAIVLFGLSYFVVPGLLIAFYRSRAIRLTFERRATEPEPGKPLPIPARVLSALLIFYALALHFLLLLNGLFPVFGTWLTGSEGAMAISTSTVVLLLLAWGVARLRTWAWWGSLVCILLLGTSATVTLARSSWLELVSLMGWPPYEVELVSGMPLHGVHFAVAIGIPLLATLGPIFYSWRLFDRGRDGWLPIV